jgi:hypothetical protein
VEAGAEMVQTSDSAISQLVDRRIWQNMPMEQRNQNSFIDLVAGAVPDAMAGSTRGAAVNGARGGAGNYLVEGTDNNDQGQGGRGQLGGAAGGAATTISPDAIQEYRVITNAFPAEYGKAGGFVTDTVLKGGTNQWHGSLFEYNRIQALAAEHYFNGASLNGGTALKDSLVRNQFGGSVGGPIIKDKTFFYYTMEYHRFRQASPLSAPSGGTTQQFLDWVNTGGMQTWAESDPTGLCNNQTFLDSVYGAGNSTATPCPGAFSQSGALAPLFQKMKQVGPFPLATANLSNVGQGVWTGGLTFPVPVYGDVNLPDPFHLNEYRITTKVDHKLGVNDQLNAVFLFQNDDQGSPYDGGGTTIGPSYDNPGRGQDYGITWVHTFSPTILNTAKASYLRHRSDFSSSASVFGVPMIVTAFDSFAVGFGQYSGFPQLFTDTQFQYQDSLSVVHGKHSFKGGAEYRRTRNGSSFYNDANGTFLPYSIEDLVTDLAFDQQADAAIAAVPNTVGSAPAFGSLYYASAALDTTTNQPPAVYRGFRANEFAAYFQDDWRVSNRLTLNLGIRWEYFGPPHNFKPNIDSNVYFGNPITPIPTASGNIYFPTNSVFYAGVSDATFQVRNHEIWNKDTNNWGPRIGLSWDALGNQKFVVRAGSGIAYDRIFNNVFENIRFNPPYFADNRLSGPILGGAPLGAISDPTLYTVPFTSTTQFGAGTHALPNPRHMDQNLVSPYYIQSHLGIQWEFTRGYVLETDYISTLGRKLIGFRDINTFDGRQVAGQPHNLINPIMSADNYRSNDYNSNYNGLQFTVRKNYSNGLSFNASYTYSKALDDMSDVFNNRSASHPTDNMNPRVDYGPADFNLKHRVIATVGYDLPFMKSNRWIGGWSVNSIISLQGGVPFSPYSASSSYDLNKDGYTTDRVVPGIAPMSTRTNGNPATGYIIYNDWSKETNPVTHARGPIFTAANCANGLFCNPPIGRNSVSGPGYKNVDFGVTKSIRITERSSVKFMANAFNLFNHPNFGLPAANLNSKGSFGKSSTTFDPRVTQLAVRIDF